MPGAKHARCSREALESQGWGAQARHTVLLRHTQDEALRVPRHVEAIRKSASRAREQVDRESGLAHGAACHAHAPTVELDD